MREAFSGFAPLLALILRRSLMPSPATQEGLRASVLLPFIAATADTFTGTRSPERRKKSTQEVRLSLATSPLCPARLLALHAAPLGGSPPALRRLRPKMKRAYMCLCLQASVKGIVKLQQPSLPSLSPPTESKPPPPPLFSRRHPLRGRAGKQILDGDAQRQDHGLGPPR